MKHIVLRAEPIKTLDLLSQILQQSPREPLNIDAIRRRCRVLDMIEKHQANPSPADMLALQDLDHVTVMQALNSFPFSVANKPLLQIIDDIEGAITEKADPATAKKGKASAALE